MDSSNKFDDSYGDRPRDVNVVEFVQQRALEISDLMAVVDNRELPSGEVAQGPRTFIQRQPRHMRRRAMSYNAKRLPKRNRQMVFDLVGEHKHRKKPPSRCYRRRAANLLNAYIRRQRKIKWLETHIWHAKRFRMTDMNGWKLPYRSCQRGFRAGYRDAVKHCIVEDTSYYCCLQLDGAEEVLIEKLNRMCQPSVGLSFKAVLHIEGCLEGNTILYEPNTYPYKSLGIVSFMWRPRDPENEKQRSLWIWCHPSLTESLLNCIIDLFNMDKAEPYSDLKPKEIPSFSSVDKFFLDKSTTGIMCYKSLEFNVQLSILDDSLLRFRLIGLKSTWILNEILKKPNSNTNSLKFKEYESEQAWISWTTVYSHLEPGRVAPGTIISLIVEDPRINLNFQKKLPTNNTSFVKSDGLPSTQKHDIAKSPLWISDIRSHILATKSKDSDINEKRKELKAVGKRLDDSVMDINSVPIVLVHQKAANNLSNNFGSGWDIILPAGWGMPFWLALQYHTAHASDAQVRQKISFETSRFEFPALWPDTAAGVQCSSQLTKQLEEKYLLRPPNRRRKYSSLKIKYPFCINWLELINGWSSSNSSFDEFYVLRDRRLLKTLRDVLKNCKRQSEDRQPDPLFWLKHLNSLVAVKIVSLGKGTPAPYGLICLPTVEDLNVIDKLNLSEENKLKNQNNNLTSKKHSSLPAAATAESLFAAKGGGEIEEDFLSFAKPLGVRIDFEELFVDKLQQKLKKRKMNEKARRKRKKLKLSASTGELENQMACENTGVNVVNSCSRSVIGFVVWGDYSFAIGRGVGLGFCSLLALKEFTKLQIEQCHKNLPTCALFRNTNSRLYRGCSLEIIT